MKVEEAMTAEVISVSIEATVREAAQLLRDHRIGGLPVVDAEHHVVGIVGEADLLPKEMLLPFSRFQVPTLFKKVISRSEMDLESLYGEMADTPVSEVMERKVTTVEADDPVGEAAWIMAHHDLKRLPVLRDDKLVGIISRSDIIDILADKAPHEAVQEPKE